MPRGVYQRKPGLTRNKRAAPVHERFAAKVVVLENGCWQWTGFIDKTGYGRINGGRQGAGIWHTHVYSYETKNGPTPQGMELDHLCRNRWCCNPDHLEAVTHRVNVLRGNAPMVVLHCRGVCKNGHSADEHACRVKRKHGRMIVAYCRKCRRDKRAAGVG